MTFDTNKAYECPVCRGHNCEFDAAENTPVEGYFDGAHLPVTFFCNDCGKEYRVNFTLRVEAEAQAEAATFAGETANWATQKED